MPDREPVFLRPIPIELGSAEFKAIAGWPFSDSFVVRVLQNDIPQRVQHGNCRIWIYRDSHGLLVGFGTLDLCKDYGQFTGGQPHPYIPLLAVNPTIISRGYGTAIVQHLIAEAAILASRGYHDVLFLDVYLSNQKAISVYATCGFLEITPEPISDPSEDGATYIVMAKRVAVAES